MGYDDWKTTEPDEPWARSVQCQKVGCTNSVTFPDFEVWCTTHILEHEQRQRELAEQNDLYEVRVRRG